MRRFCLSPIVVTFETWPLINEFKANWGRDENGELWVAVENRHGDCEGYVPYREYLETGSVRESQLDAA